MKKRKRNTVCRAAGIFLSAAMVFHMLPAEGPAVYASEKKTGLCRHHTEHTAECGYAEEKECTHEHTAECNKAVTECVHIHTDDCFPTDKTAPDSTTDTESSPIGEEPESTADGMTVSADMAQKNESDTESSSADKAPDSTSDSITAPADEKQEVRKPDNCTHICSEESGCVINELNCPHEHKTDSPEADPGLYEDCGYAKAQPCTYDCRLCPIERLIGALPAKVTSDNADTVRAQLDEILALFTELTEYEQEQIDLAICCRLQEELDAANAPAPSIDASDLDFSSGSITGDLDTDGYHWNTANSILELKNVTVSGTVTLPDSTVTIKTTGNCSIGTLAVSNPNNTHLIFSGTGVLTVQNQINISGGDGLTLTVAEGARLAADGGISIGASGGVNSTVTVYGTLTAKNTGAHAIYSGTVIVGAGGTLNVSGKYGVQLNGMNSSSSHDFTNVFTVAEGGCFTADCEDFNVRVSSVSGTFPDGSHADQAIRIPDNYLPTDCGVKQTTGQVDLIRKSTGEVYTGPLIIHENHSWPDGWNRKDGAGHWKECTFEGCDRTKDYETHRYDDKTGKCVCGSTLAVTLEGASGLIYNGQEHQPGVSVALDGTTLDASQYNITYRNNKNAGEASVTVTGKDGLTFERTVKFPIDRATPTITWGETAQTITYSGNPAVITPPTVTLMSGGNFDGELIYSHASGGSSNYTSGLPVKAGTYTVRACIAEQGNYHAAESTNTLTLKVERGRSHTDRSGTDSSGTSNPSAEQDGQVPDEEGTAAATGKPIHASVKYGETRKEIIPKLPEEEHIHDYNAAVVKEASCTETGEKEYVCSCGDRYTEDIPAHGHSYQGEVTKQPTVFAEGEMTYTCSRCGDTYTEPVDRIEDVSSEPESSPESEKTGFPWWLLVIVALAVIMGIGWFLAAKRKKGEEQSE